MPEDKHSLHEKASHTCLDLRKETLQIGTMGKVLGETLKNARLSKRLTQGEVGTALGVSRAAVGQWESGETEPTTANLMAACQLYGLNMASISDALPAADTRATGKRHHDGTNQTLRSAEADFVRSLERDPHVQNLPRDVPVFGVAEGGPGADFWMNGEIVDYVRRPSGAQKSTKIYALYIVGTSMSPRYEEGELVYVSPSRSPAIGDYVVVELHPESREGTSRGFIKRLVKRTPTKIILEQFNPPKQIEFAQTKVKSMHRVIPWVELLGV
jgi:phage repressor protein C with HTH and peptisase S24 domain